MTAPIDILVRDVTINGTPVGDARMVIGNDVGALIGRPGGTPTVISRMIAPTVADGPGGGVYTVTDGLNTWLARRDTRCGTCGGRPALARLDPQPLIAAAFA